MAIRNYKPTTNARRGMSTLINDEITSKKAGRNNQGKITVRHQGGGEKRKYRIIDFKRNKFGIEGTVASVEYDPNRSSNICLINYADGEKRYILAPRGIKVGMKVISSENADIKLGNTYTIAKIIPFILNVYIRDVIVNAKVKPL